MGDHCHSQNQLQRFGCIASWQALCIFVLLYLLSICLLCPHTLVLSYHKLLEASNTRECLSFCPLHHALQCQTSLPQDLVPKPSGKVDLLKSIPTKKFKPRCINSVTNSLVCPRTDITTSSPNHVPCQPSKASNYNVYTHNVTKCHLRPLMR